MYDPRIFLILLFIFLLPAPGAAPADDHEDSDAVEALRTWVSARAGTGNPVHWVAEGELYAYPSGEKLFGMIGFDSSTVIWPEDNPNVAVHLTRKIFTFTHPETGDILTEWEGRKIEPVSYPYQLITYRVQNGDILADVEQGVGNMVTRIENVGISYRKLGDSHIFNAATFIDLTLPNGDKLEAWENYDFFIHPDGLVEEPHQLGWERYSNLPSFAGGGPGIWRLTSWRVENYDEFPPRILNWAKENAAMWLKPPLSLEEVRKIQKNG